MFSKLVPLPPIWKGDGSMRYEPSQDPTWDHYMGHGGKFSCSSDPTRYLTEGEWPDSRHRCIISQKSVHTACLNVVAKRKNPAHIASLTWISYTVEELM